MGAPATALAGRCEMCVLSTGRQGRRGGCRLIVCFNTRTPVARVKGVRLRRPVAGRLYMAAHAAG
eukprot:12368597-Heterocapsa_arctica.AAC.1